MKSQETQVRSGTEPAVHRGLSATLAVLLLFLSFASASPALHDWFAIETICASECGSESHDSSEDSSPHICAVEIFNMGAECLHFFEARETCFFAIGELTTRCDLSWAGKNVRSQRARAPPIESIVIA